MGNNKKILVVDDDLDIIEQLELILKADGYEVFTANSQDEAKSLLSTMKPDLAIFDLMMENMDSGFVLAHHLKKLYPNTPIILLTGVTAATGLSFNARSSQAQAWLKTDLVLDKPVRPEQIKSEVSRLLGWK